MADLAIGAAIGAAAGGVGGFVASIVILAARRRVNARRIARGEAPYKNALRLRLEVGGAIFGLAAGALVRALE